MGGRRQAKAGSSPRARGTHRHHHERATQLRFIPASAGNTSNALDVSGSQSVHPRERGEHGPDYATDDPLSGSSPRARGTRSPHRQTDRPPRFIPASAGNTWYSLRAMAMWSVHPRERGEHRTRRPVYSSHNGSSPRARGTLQEGATGPDFVRFIPASAGNTSECPPMW